MAMFEREEWTLFRTLGTIGQKAGVELTRLRRLVLKELADNALDAGANCTVGELEIGRYYVEDDGPGLPGGPDDVAKLFSIRRPLTSSKLLRLPTRGAVGNGLRVVAGAVLASGGKLTVWTQNRVHLLSPQDDGITAVESEAADCPTGTRIEITFGERLALDDNGLAWARQAIAFGNANIYRGKTSAHWFDAEAFHELCKSAGELTVRKLVELFDGCAGRKAGELAADFQGRRANDLSRDEAAELLILMRDASRPVSAKRLGRVGRDNPALTGAYACADGVFEQRTGRGGLSAEIPFIVEAWATHSERPQLSIAVNRTPIASDLSLYRHPSDKGAYIVKGCGLLHSFPVVRRADFALTVNVTTPYMPITNDGKTPDLAVVCDSLFETLTRAAKRAKGRMKRVGERPDSQKAFIVAHLDEAILHTSGGDKRYSQRQLYYAIGKIHAEAGDGEKPSWEWFCQVVTDIEAERGADLPRMYRDDRGIIYHPHTGETIPLGTRSVEQYRRPEWLFHKALYIEKEGFIAALIDDGWPERNDCTLLTSKGQPTRAARDLLDLLGDTGEPLTFFCVHDADAYGTGIYQALTEATKARGARKVKVVNLGLEPEEALAMGLQVEPAEKSSRRHPVASYVAARWRGWFQASRVELNAMTTPEFIAWLDNGLLKHGGEPKLVPPEKVLRRRLTDNARGKIRDRLTTEAIREARIDERTETELKSVVARTKALDGELVASVRQALADNPERLWTRPVEALADRLLAPEPPAKLKNRLKRGGK